MLWDMTWNIIEMEGIDTNMYDGDGGNNIALQLVIDAITALSGMHLQVADLALMRIREAPAYTMME